nr:uncharacterized protein LOC117833468 isoform X1 [Setaria viridis]XP_034568864.1 uncharacterized protein LOC117833468 isoform X1 [Setaria viridis]
MASDRKVLPHALAVITTDRQPNYDKFMDMAYSVQRFKQVYNLGWSNITDRNQWPEVEKQFKLYPPVAQKRGVRRQRKNRIPSCLERTGKIKRQVKCDNCDEKGHRKGSWRCELTGTKKRKRTKKTIVKAGRKNAKEDFASEVVLTTPRKRATAAREATIAATKKAEAEPNEAEASTSMQYTKRRLDLEAPLALEIH